MLILVISLSVVLLGTALYAVILFRRLKEKTQQHTELAERNHELNAMIHSGELQALRYKLNPHLFKNALNSIQSHAYQTYYSMDKLSGVLDYILYDSDQPLVSLREEMEFAANFIEINRLKISPLFDLRVRNSIDLESAETEELRIMPLVTVDLIENAFKHTDIQKSDSFISIYIGMEKGLFQLDVSNRLGENDPALKRKGGLGLKNLTDRLAITYPDKHELKTRTEGQVFYARLTIRLYE